MQNKNSSVYVTPVSLALVFALAVLSGCGGGGSAPTTPVTPPTPPPPPPPATTYSVGGMVTGLNPDTLILQNNNGPDLVLTSNAAFVFPAMLATGATYSVTIKTQPAPPKVCSVSNGTGTIASANIDVRVDCLVPPPLTVSSITPVNNAVDVSRLVQPVITFSAAINPATATPASVVTTGPGTLDTVVSAVGNRVTVVPQQTLLPTTTYSVQVNTGVRASGGESLTVPVTTRFTTMDGRWGASAAIHSNNAATYYGPKISVAANGNAMAVWQQNENINLSSTNVLAMRYTVGSGWSAPESIESYSANAAYYPSVALDAGGNAVAVWAQRTSVTSGACGYFADHIWANRYTVSAGWGTPVLIQSDTTGVANAARIAVDVNGNAFAVWSESDGPCPRQPANLRENIWVSRYSPGAGWGTAMLLDTELGDAYEPQIVFDRSGNALAVWHQANGGRYNIMARRYDATTGWGLPVLLETADGTARFPKIAFAANGDAFALWQQSDGAREHIWFNRFVVGSGWGAATQVENLVGDGRNVQVAVTPTGNALAVWTQFDGTRESIGAGSYFVGVGPGGVIGGTGWDTALIDGSDEAAAEPQIAVDAAGNGLATWRQRGMTTERLLTRRFVPGLGWTTTSFLDGAGATGSSYNQQLAVDAAGNALAIWERFDGTTRSIWNNRFE